MANVLFIGYPAQGHINPTLGLTRELVRRGEKVTYFCVDEYKEMIERTGAEYRSMGITIESRKRKRNINASIFDKFEYRLTWMDQSIEHVMRNVTDECYDYVIHDAQSLHGHIISKMLRTPSISTWTTFSYNVNSSNWIMSKDELDAIHLPYQFKNKLHHFGNKHNYPIKSLQDLYLYSSDLHIVFTSKQFQYESETFDDTYKFVGPSIIEREDRLEMLPFKDLNNKKIIYISMGTILSLEPEIFQMCIEAFKDLDVYVIVSDKNLSARNDIEIPSNFFVYRHVPQLEVLNYCNVFITHCGMNSTNEGLYFNTPLVMIPSVNDQHMVAQRVEQAGAGIRLEKNKLSSSQIKSAVLEVMHNPLYKLNCEHIGRSLREAGGFVRAADEISKFKKLFLYRYDGV
ncbi:macrolide family glycosyltransferase [Paenibacillus alvei]|uniref:macrolide family glycosyltransferase n=1 Tax=Paenibacillus alvei TaxID=44250 RepID=UPI002281B29B|nr:macrolide family glycosyltransferase [Paenibacillus alvei]